MELEPNSLSTAYAIDFTACFGKGGYAATFGARHKSTGEIVAAKAVCIKRVHPDPEKAVALIKREVAMQASLAHANVLKILAHGRGQPPSHDGMYFILMEIMRGGDLFGYIKRAGSVTPMPEATAKVFMRQILAGVSHCHERGVAHRDLKPQNIMLTAKEGGVVKLIDFGLAHQYTRRPDGGYDRSALLIDRCGTRSYCAPEVLAGKGYDGFEADMWSLGSTLFVMLSGFTAVDQAVGVDLTEKLKGDWRFQRLVEVQRKGGSSTTAAYSFYKRTCSHLSDEVIRLIDGLLTIEPFGRLTMRQVFSHPWLEEGDGSGGDGPEARPLVYRSDPGAASEAACEAGCGGRAGHERVSAAEEDDEPLYRAASSGTVESELIDQLIYRGGLELGGDASPSSRRSLRSPASSARELCAEDSDEDGRYRSCSLDFASGLPPLPPLEEQHAFSCLENA